MSWNAIQITKPPPQPHSPNTDMQCVSAKTILQKDRSKNVCRNKQHRDRLTDTENRLMVDEEGMTL